MAHLSYIDTSAKQERNASASIPTDESVGAFLFDTGGFTTPFQSYPLLYNNFKEGTVQRVTNMDDAVLLGIRDDGFLNGLVYYHLSQFYDFIGKEQTVYVAIADCSDGWNVIQSMQQQTSGKLFHVGVWTSQPIWNVKSDGSLGFTPLITDLQAQADEVNGGMGSSTHRMTPISIMLCGNTRYVDGGEATYKSLPNAVQLECPKVSVFMLQNGTDEVHAIQENNPLQAPVTALGYVMACLAVCGAEESIGSVMDCDLNKNEGFNHPEWGVGEGNTPIDTVHRIWANTVSNLGYIIPIDYEGMEASYFLSSDQTLSEGSFGSIANNRVMHKCRRIVCTVLLPYVNSHHIYDYNTKTISNTAITLITGAAYTMLDSAMRNGLGNPQISDRHIEFLDEEDVLETQAISIRLDVKPANYSEYVTEEVSHAVE